MRRGCPPAFNEALSEGIVREFCERLEEVGGQEQMRSSEVMKHVLLLVRTAPHGSAAIAESVRACLGVGTMPFEASYLLMDDAA